MLCADPAAVFDETLGEVIWRSAGKVAVKKANSSMDSSSRRMTPGYWCKSSLHAVTAAVGVHITASVTSQRYWPRINEPIVFM